MEKVVQRGFIVKVFELFGKYSQRNILLSYISVSVFGASFTTCIYLFRLPELQGDAIVGITVGLTVLPQSIAYASIVGLPPLVCLKFVSIDV